MNNYYDIETDTIKRWQPKTYYLIVNRRKSGKTISTWKWLIKKFLKSDEKEKFLIVIPNFKERRIIEYICGDLNFLGVLPTLSNFEYSRICLEDHKICLVNARNATKTTCGVVEYEHNINPNTEKIYSDFGVKYALYDDYLPEEYETTVLKWGWYKITTIILLHTGWLPELRKQNVITEWQYQCGGVDIVDYNGLIEVTR